MKRDQQLVSDFLSALSRQYGTPLTIVRRPDEENRRSPAVEVVASDPNGKTLAIEHTLIQPFEGERIDTDRFIRVFGGLEGCDDLKKPGCNVDVIVKVGSIPTGVKWDVVAAQVREHLARRIKVLGEGSTVEPITGLPFELPVRLMVQQHGPEEADHVWISRFGSLTSFTRVVRTALERKLPKLLAQNADRRMLLLEQADVAHGHAAVRVSVDELIVDFPDLTRVDEIWLAITSCWETEDTLFFNELWPNVMGRKLKLDLRTSMTSALGA